MPETFVLRAGWGDFIAGTLALIAIVVASRAAYVAFHIIGFADFLVAVGTGITFAVLPVETMENVATFPVVMIPLFGVGLSFASHIAAFWLLWRREEAVERAPLG